MPPTESQDRPDQPEDFLDSEFFLMNQRQARFKCEAGDYRAEVELDSELCEKLEPLRSQPQRYGSALFEAIFPKGSLLREGFRETMAKIQHGEKRLRFRLHIDSGLPTEIHALFWELLLDSERHIALGQSPETAFSRYRSVPGPLGGTIVGPLRLLCVIAAPSDAARYKMAEIYFAETQSRLSAAFEALPANVDVEFLEAPATLGRISDRLVDGGFHALHIFGHGLVMRSDDEALLVLQDDTGAARFVDERLLADLFQGNRRLRLMTLLACHGSAPSSTDTFSGLAGRLVERGLPAVIAMRRTVSFEAAYMFSEQLYRSLVVSQRIDAAVNRARHQLYLHSPQGLDWSSPVLYMRLPDGRIPLESGTDRPGEEMDPPGEEMDLPGSDEGEIPLPDPSLSEDRIVSILGRFPRGPAVTADAIPVLILERFIDNTAPLAAQQILQRANEFRRRADPQLPKNAILIRPQALVANPIDRFWFDVFHHAMIRGPRMVTALLYSAPFGAFIGLEDRVRQILEELEKWTG